MRLRLPIKLARHVAVRRKVWRIRAKQEKNECPYKIGEAYPRYLLAEQARRRAH